MRDSGEKRGRRGTGIYPFSMHVIQILIYILMLTDARVLGGIVCIPVGILMLSQCRQSGEDNTETSAKYDPLAVVGGAGMLFLWHLYYDKLYFLSKENCLLWETLQY